MIYLIPESDIYVAGFSKKHITLEPSKISFLSGLAFAFSVTIDDSNRNIHSLCESQSCPAFSNLLISDSDEKKKRQHGSSDNILAMHPINPITEFNSVTNISTYSSEAEYNDNIHEHQLKLLRLPPTQTIINQTYENVFLSSFSGMQDFHFPAIQLPVQQHTPSDLNIGMIKQMNHYINGSNSKLFIGNYLHQKVILKILKEDITYDEETAILEFDTEYAILNRISHQHIVKVLGAGCVPRRFIILEYLDGGSLSVVMRNLRRDYEGKHASNGTNHPSQSHCRFAPNLTLVLSWAKQLADAVVYLHHEFHPAAVIIHRDLKPGVCICIDSTSGALYYVCMYV